MSQSDHNSQDDRQGRHDYRIFTYLRGLSMSGAVSALLLVSGSGLATAVETARSTPAEALRTDIEINGMESVKDCADLAIEYSKRRGEIHVSFEDPYEHSSDDKLAKKHCLVDFEVYVPENVRFQLDTAELLGYVGTDGSTFAKVATSYRPIGKAGAVATRKFGPHSDRNFYLESPRLASVVNSSATEGRCGGYSMTLRLRVDLAFSDRLSQAARADRQKASQLRIYSANLGYRTSRC